MTLPEWKAIPVRTRRSRKRLHNLIATEFSLLTWIELPNPIKRSKKKLFNYYAEELHLEEFKELLKNEVRSTRIYYNYLKENADPSSAPTLTVIITDGTDPLKNAEVTINETTETTDATGTAEFTLDYDDYIAEIQLAGYITQEVELKFRSNKKTFNIILEEQQGTSGTLTVTCVDSEQTPLENSIIFTSDEQYATVTEFLEAVEQDLTIALGYGLTDNTGEALIMTMGEDWQPIEPIIEFEAGTYYIYAVTGDFAKGYVGTVNINGDTTTTITLTLIEGG